MHSKPYLPKGLLIACWLLAVITPATAQLKRGEHLFFNRAFPYKNGVLFMFNNYTKEVKKVNGLLPGENRPNGIFAIEVTGMRTTFCFTPKPMPDTLSFGPMFDGGSKTILNLPALRVRVSKNGKVIRDWQPAARSTPSVDTFIGYYPAKRNYNVTTLSDDTLAVDDELVVDGRQGNDSNLLFTYHIRRIAKPIHPRLFAVSHQWEGNESRIDPQMVNKQILRKDSTLRWIDRDYADWLDGMHYDKALIAAASRFIFYFGRPDNTFADSTMEYRVIGGKYKDTGWIKTGHMILLDGLTGNNWYRMEVRYSRYPANTEVYTFYTQPHWYQSNWFKGTVGTLLALLLITFIFLLYRHRLKKEKEKKAQIAARLKGMQAQLNPHFIFNALGSIQALMNKQENDKAHQYLSTFGSLLRNVLNNSNQDDTTLDQEIRSLDAYLQLEQLRSGFQYRIDTTRDIQTSTLTIPVMLLQPLVENAIRHGVAGMEEKGLVEIAFTKHGNDLLAAVQDNGKGFDPAAPRQGFGLKLVEEKIQLINALQEQQVLHMDIRSSDTGTTVLLTFKNWLA